MPASIHGDKSQLRILEDGQTVDFFTITSFDAREDSQAGKSYYVGEKDPETFKNIMGWSGQLNGEVKSPAIDYLIQRQNDAYRAGVNVPNITIVLVHSYENGSASTDVFLGVTMNYDSIRIGGVNEKTTKSISFEAKSKRVDAA